ncbi:hypothetical protein C8Q76DRAFT_789934 [Earliella scabrosa]|nr:hypothetical protein C8Q76DRAFT_789934 [Earliella scabrosa]
MPHVHTVPAGETLGDGSNADMNLYDAILLGTKRIGHGNEILRLTGSMPMHPLPAIIKHGVPIALCSGDPSVFGNMGLAFDFFQVFGASEVNGLHTLLAWDTIRFSGFDDDEKKRALRMLERRWAKFVTRTLLATEYSVETTHWPQTSRRTSSAKSVWGQQLEVERMQGPQQMFPGMEFFTVRETIVHTKIFNILSRGRLHADLDATVRACADVLLRLALKHEAMHVRTLGSLSKDKLKTLLPQFCALPINERTPTASLTYAQYVPNSWVPLQNARNNFSEALGGPHGFDRWGFIWQKFQSTFFISAGLIHYLPVWKEYVREFLLSFVEDGISYVEPRILFYFKHLRGDDGEEKFPHRFWLEVFDQILTEVKSTLAAQDRADEFVGAKIIYTTMRAALSSPSSSGIWTTASRSSRRFRTSLQALTSSGTRTRSTPSLDVGSS